jgi:simple sugar transport system ATP-binding protein
LRNLSGGNVQKLLVGREFSQGKRLLVIEDPTRGIDVGAIEFIWQRILEMAASGFGILLVSHELNEVMQISDRILVMHNGVLLAPERSRELSEEELGLWMLGGHGSDE